MTYIDLLTVFWQNDFNIISKMATVINDGYTLFLSSRIFYFEISRNASSGTTYRDKKAIYYAGII